MGLVTKRDKYHGEEFVAARRFPKEIHPMNVRGRDDEG
jgi:hypothetical protein